MTPDKNKTSGKRRAGGFSLIEVVIASALLIVALIPILKGLTNAQLSTTVIERKTRSIILAQGKLDKIRARSIYHYSDTFSESNSTLDGRYLCNVTDDADPNLRSIAVSVGYDANSDSALSAGETEITLTTYVARRW